MKIKISENNLVKTHKEIATNASADANKLEILKLDLKLAKLKHRKTVRSVKNQTDDSNDKKLFSIMSSSPSSAFRFIKSSRSSSQVQVSYITVGDKKYEDERIVDGFYDSLLKLKMLDTGLVTGKNTMP